MGINPPYVVDSSSISRAWVEDCERLIISSGEARNLFVYIREPITEDGEIRSRYDEFCRQEGLLLPKHVAYTIFPMGFASGRDAVRLYRDYNKPGGLYERIKTSWGTYFRRITYYEVDGEPVNQLGNIIEAINGRARLLKAAYTINIQKPAQECTRPRGGPCLNYLTLQLERGEPNIIGMLAVYRNQDYSGKAYGNFLGLGRLLEFICRETSSRIGPLTCVSSHAYLEQKGPGFVSLIKGILGN